MAMNIMMTRPDLDNLPEIILPAGYSLVTGAQLPDVQAQWVNVINTAFGDSDWTIESVQKDYIDAPQSDLNGVFFILHENIPVATAFGWRDTPNETECGRVHWVGTLEGHRGKRLGGAVVLAVLHYFAQRGFSRAILETQAFRMPAIRLYVALGFVPTPRNDEEEKEWAGPVQELGLTL